LPRSKKQFPLTAQYIEDIHDQGIAIAFPGLEPVHPHDCLDRNLLESAAEQPFQGGFGVDYFYPTIYDKAACLFFSIAGGHIFGNGNKRTGVLALDQFLWANSIYLLLQNTEIHDLAIWTATYRTRNQDPVDVKATIARVVEEESLEFRLLRRDHPSLYARLHRVKRIIRSATS
jgi:prophage maintenance system killer protein